MYSIKTNLDILGTTAVGQTLNVQGVSVFANTINGRDVNFQNATFNLITAAGEISADILSATSEITSPSITTTSLTATAGQVISLMFRSSNTNSTCVGSTIIVEKLD